MNVNLLLTSQSTFWIVEVVRPNIFIVNTLQRGARSSLVQKPKTHKVATTSPIIHEFSLKWRF